ncbi:MAG: ABC transporter substrate-binding protein [Thiotrichaceae bacterium]|nr:ABC transporter substrate-binding protein [Thiotrichaceae bacterium]
MRYIKLFLSIFLGFSLLLVSALWLFDSQYLVYFQLKPQEKAAYHIAFVGPLSGQGKLRGQDMLNGAKMYIQEINRKGGINGHLVKLLEYNDLDDSEEAKVQAKQIVSSKALAVLGNGSSLPALHASSIYKEGQISAITGSATLEGITKDNDWYFRMVNSTDTQSKFLSHYLYHILQQKTASIIYDRAAKRIYNASLTAHFIDGFQKNEGEINYLWSFDSTDKIADQVFDEIVAQVRKANIDKKDVGAIFISASRSDSVTLIAKLRRQGIHNMIVGSNYMASTQFAELFKQEYPEERRKSGILSDYIFANATIIFDVAGKEAQEFRKQYIKQYDKEPSWRAATYYDATKVIVEALRHIEKMDTNTSIKEKRHSIKQYLSRLDSEESSLEGGLTAQYIYFDKNGDIVRPPVFGMFKNGRFISAMTQLEPVKCPAYLTFQTNIYKIEDSCVQKVNMVYTGINVQRISNIDLDNLTYDAEFDIWFRYRKNVKTSDVINITFDNALTNIELGKPIVDESTKEIKYQRYSTKATFKIQFSAAHQAYEQPELEIQFHHKIYDSSQLVYVTDTLALAYHQEYIKEIDIPTQWQIKGIRYYQLISKQPSLGNPIYLQNKGNSKHSLFNMNINISKNHISLRTLIAERFSAYLFIICFIGLIVTIFFHRRGLACYKQDDTKSEKTCAYSSLKILWVVKAIFWVFLVLSAEMVLIEGLQKNLNPSTLNLVLKIFEASWWILYAHLTLTALEEFVWIPIEKHTNQIIPQVLHNSIAVLAYILACMAIFAFVFDQKITSLLATSGVVAMIVGLAVQINISNVFSGIAINAERPFRIGDWILIGKNTEGQVMNITWRTTRIRTFDGNIISIPNSIAAESMINNYNFPDDRHWLNINVHLDFEYSPQAVKDVLMDAISSIEYVLEEPAPKVNVILLEWSVEYTVSFCVRDYSQHKYYQTEATQTIWQYLRKAELPLAKK